MEHQNEAIVAKIKQLASSVAISDRLRQFLNQIIDSEDLYCLLTEDDIDGLLTNLKEAVGDLSPALDNLASLNPA
jgi:hypothetical protein